MGETTRAQISLCFRPASLRSSVWARLLDMAAGRIMVAVVVNFSDLPAEAKVFYLPMLLSFTDDVFCAVRILESASCCF